MKMTCSYVEEVSNDDSEAEEPDHEEFTMDPGNKAEKLFYLIEKEMHRNMKALVLLRKYETVLTDERCTSLPDVDVL
jgi:hypothetical protein